jgi:mannose-6-phosphate isomerase-like protein (cupin superfamily)
MRPHPSAVAVLLFAITACATPARGRVVTADGPAEPVIWTAEEQARPIAVRALRATPGTSLSLIRLRAAEKPHIHQHHDLVVVMLSGGGVLHLGERSIAVHPGDVMEIPRGTVHWAENTDPLASEVYAVFSPPYDGLDNIPVLPFTAPKP